jgi:hypothetical protein
VQEDGGHALGRKADLVGNDLRDGERMPEEGLPVAAHLSLERLFGQVISFPDQVAALGGVLQEKSVVHRWVQRLVRASSARWKARALFRCSL